MGVPPGVAGGIRGISRLSCAPARLTSRCTVAEAGLRRDPVDQVGGGLDRIPVQANDDIPGFKHAIGVTARQNGIHLHTLSPP